MEPCQHYSSMVARKPSLRKLHENLPEGPHLSRCGTLQIIKRHCHDGRIGHLRKLAVTELGQDVVSELLVVLDSQALDPLHIVLAFVSQEANLGKVVRVP